MFIKRIVKTDKKSGKQYNYYRLCQSYRVNVKRGHRTIISLGKLENLKTKEERKLLADRIEDLLTRRKMNTQKVVTNSMLKKIILRTCSIPTVKAKKFMMNQKI